MFFKKLFGIKPAPAPSLATDIHWLNLGWIQFSYPYRQGSKSTQVEVDPCFQQMDERTGLQYCLRIWVAIDPEQQTPLGTPSTAFAPTLEKMQASLFKALNAQGASGKLVARIAYSGLHEWVLMLENPAPIANTLNAWRAEWKNMPLIEAAMAEGWEYYETTLAPSTTDKQYLNTQRQFEELKRQGTNPEAQHKIRHRFMGASTQIQALHDQLLEDKFWIESKENGKLQAFLAVPFELQALHQHVTKVMEHAERFGVTYEGWQADVVKLQLLSGSNQDGFGSQMYANGSIYTGEFKAGNRHGRGKFVFESGEWYEGDWVMGKRTGFGKYNWSHKEQYEGEFFEGMLHGQGTYRYENGNVYSGQWENDVRHGRGTLHYAVGGSYTGDWVKDKRHGQGRFNYITPPEWYEGEFFENKIHGNGKEFSATENRIRIGRWNMDKFEQETTPQATSTQDWDFRSPEGLVDILAQIRNHAAQAAALGKVPCLLIQAAGMAESQNLKHYFPLDEISLPLAKTSILVLPQEAALPALQSMGAPAKAWLLRLNPDGSYAGKCIDSPVWHEDRLQHASDKLKYFMMN